jgi:hypothetical protein
MDSKDLDFLWWLERYIGTWCRDGATYQVRRCDDGWLEARQVPGFACVPLSTALKETVRGAEPTGPLGPGPVVVNLSLMQSLFTPDEIRWARAAQNVSTGRRLIMEKLERRAAEMEDAERKRKSSLAWSAAKQEGPDAGDIAYLQELRAEYDAT